MTLNHPDVHFSKTTFTTSLHTCSQKDLYNQRSLKSKKTSRLCQSASLPPPPLLLLHLLPFSLLHSCSRQHLFIRFLSQLSSQMDFQGGVHKMIKYKLDWGSFHPFQSHPLAPPPSSHLVALAVHSFHQPIATSQLLGLACSAASLSFLSSKNDLSFCWVMVGRVRCYSYWTSCACVLLSSFSSLDHLVFLHSPRTRCSSFVLGEQVSNEFYTVSAKLIGQRTRLLLAHWMLWLPWCHQYQETQSRCQPRQVAHGMSVNP